MTGHKQNKTKQPWYSMSDETFTAMVAGGIAGGVAAVFLILAICV